MKSEKKNIYIIGDIPSILDDKTFEKFNNAELNMISKGFRVFNPLSDVNVNTRKLDNEMKIKNIQNLFKSDAIYLLPCAEINQNNLELKISILLDLLVVHGLDLSIEKSKKRKVK
ncbi:hypothetical protein GCM10022389_29340 [Flavobacterium cheonanense]|uniref:Uncharacterized protein n=1 Tax=Flavobacterium cheonanense TaxID=706183 RepID=A0ABP7W5G8_9FLAO